jgi:hypothetical protein
MVGLVWVVLSGLLTAMGFGPGATKVIGFVLVFLLGPVLFVLAAGGKSSSAESTSAGESIVSPAAPITAQGSIASDQRPVQLPSIIGGDTKTRGDDLWAQAIEAANTDRSSDAERLFGLAIKADPWRFCGIGRGSWKPAKPHQQSLWLQAMRDVGLGDVATAIASPPAPKEMTIMSMMAVDDQLEDTLKAACARLGWSRESR